MNRRQRWALWAGVFLFTVAGIFPPWISRTRMPNGPIYNERSFHFIASKAERVQVSSIDMPVLVVEWILVGVIGTAAVVTLAGATKSVDERK